MLRWRYDERMSPVRALMMFALLLTTACRAGSMPEIKAPGVFIESDGYLVEIKKLGTLGSTYGPRVYPELPEYDIPAVTKVSPIYLNLPELAQASLKGVEWHGYRLGGNASPDVASSAKPQDWKVVPLRKEATSVPGIFKVVVAAADAQGRWKPESGHEYFGLAVDAGYKPGSIWAVKLK